MKREILANLRDVLANLYSDEFSMRRIIDDSALDSSRITLSSTTVNNWHSILTEAEKVGRVDALLGVIEREYGSNQKFRDVCNTYRRSASQASRNDDQGPMVKPIQEQELSELAQYRKDALAHTKYFIEQKSRALKIFGILPQFLPRTVSFHDKNLHARFSQKGQYVPPDQSPPTMSLVEAAGRDRRTLLIGDLGAGKSTLAGIYVEQILQASQPSLAFVIPASTKSIKLEPRSTRKELLQGISTYFNEQISLGTAPINLESLLNNRTHVCLVVDGLDEISNSQASELITQLSLLVSHWTDIQIVATGRPVELYGVNYEDWQILSLLPLQDEEKLDLFEAEAIATGKTVTEARTLAKKLLQKLKTLPILEILATTPLIIRLLYNRLLDFQDGKILTLGDLLYDLIKQRLGEWAAKDRKQSSTKQFEAYCPDSSSRVALFGQLALRLALQDQLTIEQVQFQLQQLIPNNMTLSGESFDFLKQSGLIQIYEGGLRFSIQPFYEYLCGHALALLWNDGGARPDWLRLQHWRIVSFASTSIRRLGLTEKLRKYLLDFLHELLLQERIIPAASYIVTEAQDKVCAETFIKDVSKLGLRPLTIFGDEYEHSSRSIAETIKLAGQAGFEWFFEHYLDPRYPIVDAGTSVTDRVFEQWVAISIDQITEYEKSQLRKLIIPYIQSETHARIHIIPALTVLMPDEFELSDALWFCANYLGRSLFEERVEKYFEQIYESGNGQIVNAVLLQHAQRGYENAKSAAWLWLKLNPGFPPNIIVLKTLLCAYGRAHIHITRQEYLDHCVEITGQSNWMRFLRWCLFDSNHYTAAGAAIELYKYGERRLSLLGEPLLHALHDGGYFKLAEEILSSLVHQIGLKAVKWLASQIAATEYDAAAHSGWWRILLSEIQNLADGPRILARCIGGMGPYIMPRHPEVRMLFKNLLTGDQGSQYIACLRECLNHINPAIRHGAAMVLIICDPKTEKDALEIVVKSSSRETLAPWYEWEKLCLSLSFSSSILLSLRSKIQTFDQSAKVFALALLYKNGIKLEQSEFDDLVNGLLESGNSTPDTKEGGQSILADPRAFDILVNALDSKSDEDKAAGELLEHHDKRLSPILRAKCVSFAMTTGAFWWLPRPQEHIEKMRTDPGYEEIVRVAMEEIVSTGKRKPLLELLREALSKDSAWEDVVWRLLCDSSNVGMNNEDNGQWLLDFGRIEPGYQKVIGKAAQKFLQDPRLSNQNDIIHWLILIADEFVGLPHDMLENTLLSGKSSFRSTASALIARVDNQLPKDFTKRTHTETPSNLSQENDEAGLSHLELFNKFKELLRAIEELHPEVCQIIEKLILTSQLSNVNDLALPAEDTNGILLLNTISYLDGHLPNISFVVSLLGSRIMNKHSQGHCLDRLLQIWRSQYWAIQEDEKLHPIYIEFLNKELAQTDDFHRVLALGRELLIMRVGLDELQSKKILASYTHRWMYDEQGVDIQLMYWFAADLDEKVVSFLTKILEQSLMSLDVYTWDRHQKTPFKFLLCPLAYWKLAGKSTELSYRVFLRGLKFAFATPGENPESNRGIEILSTLEPLLSKVPKSLIDEAMAFGRTVDDPLIRSLCRLL